MSEFKKKKKHGPFSEVFKFLIFKTLIYSLSPPIRFLMSVAEPLKRSLQSVRLAGNAGSCAKGANTTINKDHNLYI